MKILALDTSSKACSVALQVDAKSYNKHTVQRQHHNQLVLTYIDELLHQADIVLKDLDYIVYGQGPGSFTGIRLAAAVTQGLAFASGIPVIAISSLQLLAQCGFAKHKIPEILVCVDARMDEVYFAHYQVVGKELRLVGKEQCIHPEAAIVPNNSSCLGVGDGWPVMPSLANVAIDSDLIYPNAVAMFGLAENAIHNNDFTPLEKIQPNYLREMRALYKTKEDPKS